MRPARSVLILSLLLLGFPVWAQQSPFPAVPPGPPSPGQSTAPNLPPGFQPAPPLPWTPKPVRDPQAVEIVTASVNAMGGAAIIGQVQNYVVQAQFQSASGSGSTTGGQIVWTVAGSEYRADYPTATGSTTLSSGNGKPFHNVNGVIQSVGPHNIRSLIVPALVGSVLLKELQDANYSLEYGGTSTLGSEPVTVVRTSSQATQIDSMVTPQTWYFDSATGLPLRIESLLFDVKYLTRHASAAMDLSAYRAIGGILCPFQAVQWIGSRKLGTVMVTSVQGNTNIDLTVFNAPAGGAQ